MADNEIIKAMECCTSKHEKDCEYCFYDHKPTDTLCIIDLMTDALALINRQKAEDEEQQSVITVLKQSNINLQELYQNQKEKLANAKQKIIDIAKALQIAKAEIERLEKHNTEYARKHYNDGVKEFAEKLKDNSFYCDMSFGYGKENYEEAVSMIEVERIAKEMVGE